MKFNSKIRPSVGEHGAGMLNTAVAVMEAIPTPVKLIIIGGVVIAVDSACSANRSPICAIPIEQMNPDTASRPLTLVKCGVKDISQGDQDAYAKKYGSPIKDIYLWSGVNKGDVAENTGDGVIAFSTYAFENGRTVVAFPNSKDQYGTSEDKVFDYKADWVTLEGQPDKVFYSYHYQDPLNPDKERSFFLIEFDNPNHKSLAEASANPSILGNPKTITISNPPANEQIVYDVNPGDDFGKKLIAAVEDMFKPQEAHAMGLGTQTPGPTASPEPSITPTPAAKTETIEGKSYTVSGYEARDSAGVLQYIQDTEGKWIKAPPEVAAPVDTELATRLGTDFALNSDGNGITGVEGLTIDTEKGTATFNFDGKGEETFSTSDIHVATKDINGQPMKPKLLMAGYAWNPEAGKWEIYNPGFPMDTAPKDELGWFNQNDIANGNWLRWHQRATANIDKEALFKNAMVPDGWYAQETLINQDLDGNGAKDVLHLRKLVWTSGAYNSSLRADQKEIIKKDQFPWRGGLSFSYLINSDCVIVSLDVQNGDRSKTSMPTVLDSVLWTDFRNSVGFTRAALASGHEWDSSMVEGAPDNDTEGWVFGLIINSLPDATMTNSMGQSDVAITKEPQAAQRREETVVGSKIAPSAGLEIWGSIVLNNFHG